MEYVQGSLVIDKESKMTLVKGPKVKDINKVIPKDYHISGVEIQKGLRSDDSEYFYVSIKITHNEYLTNSELFEPIDLPYITIDAPKEERVKKTENSKKEARKRLQVDVRHFGFALEPSQLKIK